MKQHLTRISFIALLIIGFASVAFIKQSSPKKKAVKKPSTASTQAAKSKITWYSMTDGFAKAKKENKMVVVDVYTDWCYWCKVMDQQTYGNAAIIKKMNKYFVAVKFNPEVNAKHIVNGETMSSDQLVGYLTRGGKVPGYPMTYVWKTLTDNASIAPYTGYLDTTTFNGVMNKYIQD
jgi:thiol:disulfide interchange protein